MSTEHRIETRLHPLDQPLSDEDRCSCGHGRWRHGLISGCAGCDCALNYDGVAGGTEETQ